MSEFKFGKKGQFKNLPNLVEHDKQSLYGIAAQSEYQMVGRPLPKPDNESMLNGRKVLSENNQVIG